MTLPTGKLFTEGISNALQSEILANPRTAEWHRRGWTADASGQLGLISPATMFDAIGEAGIDRIATKMEVGFTRMAHWPTTHTLVEIKQ